MKYILLFCLFVSGFLLSQNQRFVYEYSFKNDSLNKEHVGKEIMNLDVTKEGSRFYSVLLIARDSLFKSEFERGKMSRSILVDMRKIKQSKVNFRISKSYPSLETTYHTMLNAVNIALKEEHPIKWTIFSETQNIENFKVQKATADFGGRHWMAWFANDIQIQDGPYKFCGLPGLILNVEDDKGEHRFSFIGSQKIKDSSVFLDSKVQEVFVSKEKFNKLWNDYKKDPAKNIKLMHGSSAMSETILFDSNTNKPLTKEELIRNKEQGAKAYFEKNNNFIEKDLYK
ncbi:GLPGLI family protein [Soonwooa purpurea]